MPATRISRPQVTNDLLMKYNSSRFRSWMCSDLAKKNSLLLPPSNLRTDWVLHCHECPGDGRGVGRDGGYRLLGGRNPPPPPQLTEADWSLQELKNAIKRMKAKQSFGWMWFGRWVIPLCSWEQLVHHSSWTLFWDMVKSHALGAKRCSNSCQNETVQSHSWFPAHGKHPPHGHFFA